VAKAEAKPVESSELVIDYNNLINSDIWAQAANPKAKLKALNRNLGNTKSKLFAQTISVPTT
jgi:hypothetical protein